MAQTKPEKSATASPAPKPDAISAGEAPSVPLIELREDTYQCLLFDVVDFVTHLLFVGLISNRQV